MMGYTTIGILQIAVVTITCGMGCIWPFIEGFLILLLSFLALNLLINGGMQVLNRIVVRPAQRT